MVVLGADLEALRQELKPVIKQIGFYHKSVKTSEQTDRFLSQKCKNQ